MAAEKKKAEGNDAFQAKDYDKAIALYSEAIELDDMQHVFYANRAAAHLAKGDFENARSDAKKCIALDPTFSKAYLRLATAEKELGNKKEALEVVREGMAQFGGKDGGKKAKKSGLSDFKKLEKELKTALNPPRAPPVNPVEQAVRSAQQPGEELQSLGQKVVAAKYKLQDLQRKAMMRSREHQEKQIVLRTLEQDASVASGTPPVTYRRMGKAFLAQECGSIIADMKKEMSDLETELSGLKRGEAHLKRSAEDAQKLLQETLRRRQQ